MLVDDDAEVHEIVDPKDAAESAGLVYVTDDKPGITREKRGDGFVFRTSKGAEITDPKVIDRIRHLAIPPAYRDVWICPKANGHLQATGRDDRGRKQYRYHPAFREVRDSVKFEHMTDFAAVLPTIRTAVKKHMGLHGLPREKVLATVVYLLETTLIRVGNEGYAKDNESYGLTTLRDPHVDIHGSELHFEFKGKSNKIWNLHVRDKRAAKIVHACQDLPGQHLFQYLDHDGAQHSVSSHDVNDYLHEITGHAITAKDFRTWAGTVLAALALHEFEAFDTQAHAKKNVRAAIEHVAARLGNTPTICRKCYVHPEVVKTYMSGELKLQIKQKVEAELRDNLSHMSGEEAAVLAMLEARFEREVEQPAPAKPKRKASLKPSSTPRPKRTRKAEAPAGS